MAYLPRVVDDELRDRLRSPRAVVIEGPKACGKTATATQQAATKIQLDVDLAARDAASVAPELVLSGPPPVLLDEWQVVPELWNATRRAVDDREGKPGQFILTGSSTPDDDLNRHSGAGRFSFLRMRPMSLWESGESSGQVSLSGILAGAAAHAGEQRMALQELAVAAVRGGWPGAIGAGERAGARGAGDYLRQVTEVDVAEVAGTRRDGAAISRLVSALARGTAQNVAVSSLAKDSSISVPTANAYLDILARLMISEPQPAWSPSLQSAATVRKAPKWHLADPSLSVAAAAGSSASADTLLRNMPFLGQVFESLVVRDLRIYSQPLDGEVFHYRDSNGLEVDVVIAVPSGWAAFEVKLGAGKIDEGATALLRLVDRVNTEVFGKPLALGVITGPGYAYQRPDGVQVIPINALRP